MAAKFLRWTAMHELISLGVKMNPCADHTGSYMERGGTTPHWLRCSKTHSEGFFNRARALHREAKAETCLRISNMRH
jgi:hypothetical protein